MSYKRCPNCGVMLKGNKKVCPRCNYSFKKSKVVEPKENNPKSNPTSRSNMKQCPNCGRKVNSSAINCGFCGHTFSSGTNSRFNRTSRSGMIECPHCGSMVNSSAINCGFCGRRLSGGTGGGLSYSSNSGMKQCPNCGVMLRQNKKVCPKCNYSFKKSKVEKPKVKKPKVNKPKVNKPKVTKPIHPKHFDNGVVSFDYPDYYSKDFNYKYREIGILASFKIGSNYNFDSAFAVFDGQPISDNIPDSKFKEVIEKSLDSDVLDINRYIHEEKERIIIKIQNNTNDNIEYRCYVPEIGFSILFVIPDEKEYLFDEKCVSTVVNSLEKSTGKSIIDKEPVSTVVSSSKKSISKSVPKKEVKTCSNCGTENDNDAIFCMECGMKLDISNDVNFCIHCGTEVVPGARFCMNCGKLIEY